MSGASDVLFEEPEAGLAVDGLHTLRERFADWVGTAERSLALLRQLVDDSGMCWRLHADLGGDARAHNQRTGMMPPWLARGGVPPPLTLFRASLRGRSGPVVP